MDPFSAPGWGSAPNYQGELEHNVAQTAPLARNWNGAQTGVNIQQVFNKPPATPQSSNISKFFHFIGGVGSEVGHLANGASHWLGQQVAHMAMAVPRQAAGFQHAIMDNMDINRNNALTRQNSDTLNNLHAQYKSGRISAKDYQLGLKELMASEDSLTQQQISLQNRIKADRGDAIQATIDTAAVLTTILTAGFGSVGGKTAAAAIGTDGLTQVPGEALSLKAAADYLKSSAANIDLTTVEGTINKLATNPELFARLAPGAQKAVQTSVAEVVANNGTMTAGQIARASTANLALKYPIYFNLLSTQGQQIYEKLDNKEYGPAVQQLAVNAALLLSGGPIGRALKYGGKAMSGVGSATFRRSSFLDELSKGIGDGNPAGLFNAINDIKDSALRADVIKNLSAVEATNMAATTGRDSVAAAWRVLNGMSSYEGISMSQFTHEEALNNMVNFAKAQRLVDEVGKANNLGSITVGRVDARALNTISAELSPLIEGGNKDSALNAWEALKAENLSQAWANNDNFDRQIKSLINRHEDPASLDSAIRGIRASFQVKGFPEKAAKELSKMGYLPIKPVNLEAPFQEGAGKLASRFAQNDDFFTKAVQPLPILGSVGTFLTHLGLSPTASTSRVYQLFNQNLADNLTRMQVVERFVDKGASNADTADNIIKKLSDYAHNPTRGVQVSGRPLAPITDLRQLTTKDIVEALQITQSDAREVKAALLDSMLQVPLQVRGLGDKLVDLSYKLVPTTARYLRVQGAARFAWNPFFQAKLAYKTELLAQAEAHGKFPTLGGTNTILSTIFPDKYRQIDSVRDVLRSAGVFEKKAAYGEAIGGEAVNDVGIAGANLTHKLLPSQERSLASLVQVQADRVGMDVPNFVKYFPNEVRDTVQMIAQYDRNSQFLNSAMARTLNLAFFPFRFEYKVASIMARNLGAANPMTQLAVINGLYRAHDWLNSTEGQAWYSENAEVIGIIKYFTPIQTLAEVGNLLGGHPDSVGSFGELGGLPFGWIPQLLDAEGLTNFGGAYVNPKTGQQVPDYVPTTDKGKLASAIQDLIGSLFTYPGATLGLPSKTSLDRNIALGVTGATKKDDFSKVTPPLNDREQNFSDIVQGMANSRLQQSTGLQQNVQTPPPEPQLQPTTQVKPQSSPLTTPIPKPSSAKNAKGSKPKKLKKSEFRPQLLPGQSKLGQL